MQTKDHWEKVYTTKAVIEVSWFQEHAELSLRLIRDAGIETSASIIDVGGGASTLVDDLLAHGYRNLTVLDLSRAALAALPKGPVTLMVHIASIWVPFTSESKEAVAAYPEIQKELRLALQSVGRKLGMYVRRRNRVRHDGERRNIFLRYLGEVATAVSEINGVGAQGLYERLMSVARRRTADADLRLDDGGRPVVEPRHDLDFGDNVLIVSSDDPLNGIQRAAPAEPDQQVQES